ncbi:hypothetical protein BH11PSE3_BH11PSE3_42050 [soil metagenome]
MNRETTRLARYGAIGALCILVVGGAYYLFERPQAAAPAQQQAAAKPSAKAATAKPPINGSGDDLDVPSVLASEAALKQIGEARRLADDGKFAEAQARLDQADKAAPGLHEIAETRRKITELSTPEGQFETQLARARSAIEQDDDAAAQKALAEAERRKPLAPEIAVLTKDFDANQKKERQRHGRVAALLSTMREAIARHDIAGADAALNEASRIDVLDPALDQARSEIARAHDAEHKQSSKW